jgi:hypothetical protein
VGDNNANCASLRRIRSENTREKNDYSNHGQTHSEIKYIHDNAEFTRGDVFRHCGSWDEVRYVDVGSSKDPAVFSEERLPRFADFLTQIGSHERKAFVGAFSSETV